MEEELLEELLENAMTLHPREVILVLRGEVRRMEKDRSLEIMVKDYLLPPLAYHGPTSSGFNPFMLPLDSRIVGTVHSHPLGSLKPSVTDLNHMIGFFTMILTYPYRRRDIAVYDREGERVSLKILR